MSCCKQLSLECCIEIRFTRVDRAASTFRRTFHGSNVCRIPNTRAQRPFEPVKLLLARRERAALLTLASPLPLHQLPLLRACLSIYRPSIRSVPLCHADWPRGVIMKEYARRRD